MQGFARLATSALFLLLPFSVFAQDVPANPPAPSNPSAQADQNTPPKQETPQPQTNPATQANLPNAPSSIITAKPHGQGKVPLEDIPHPPVDLIHAPLNILGDTYRMVTSPIYIRGRDAFWLLPVAAAAGVSFSQDTHVARDVVSHDTGFNNSANAVSNDLLYSYIAGGAAMYGAGLVSHNDHLHETGILSGQAMIDAYIFDSIVKLASFRERPTPADQYAGNFYQTSAGANSSFISGHSIMTWSEAAVIAAEYPSPWKQAGIYAGATATSLNRVLAEKHFPTDVLLGGVAGWMIGHYVVRAHHCHPIYRHHGNQPPDCARTR